MKASPIVPLMAVKAACLPAETSESFFVKARNIRLAKTAVNVVGNDRVLIYGVEGSPDIKKELKKRENQIVGTAAQSPINIGKKAAETADNILDGNDYEKEVYEEVFMINKDNVDMYGTDGWQ